MNSNGKPATDEHLDARETEREHAPIAAGQPEVPDVMLDAMAQAMIGRQLRTIYDEIRQQEVPDHLLALLDELERKERQS